VSSTKALASLLVLRPHVGSILGVIVSFFWILISALRRSRALSRFAYFIIRSYGVNELIALRKWLSARKSDNNPSESKIEWKKSQFRQARRSQKNDILLSVIIPCIGEEAFFYRALASATKWNAPGLEIIVVNDGGPKISWEKLLFAIPSWIDLKLIQGPNSGLGAARNAGKSVARGEFVLFLDSDDEITVETAHKVCRELTQLGLHWALARSEIHVDSMGITFPNNFYPFWTRTGAKTLTPQYVFSNWGVDTSWPIHSAVIRRSSCPNFEKLNRGEDYLFWLSLLSSHGFQHSSNELLATYHWHPNQMTVDSKLQGDGLRNAARIAHDRFEWVSNQDLNRRLKTINFVTGVGRLV
jgi:hypothetical protein